jgi:proteasome lid subunit RPN8/RPN11
MVMKGTALKQMRSHLEKSYPYEGCGVMLGKGDVVTTIHCGTNVRRDRQEDRFLLAPADVMDAEKLAKKNNIEILGFYHSHPDHPARPSLTDLENAWEGYYYLITSVNKGTMEDIGLFRLAEQGGNFVQEPFKIED